MKSKQQFFLIFYFYFIFLIQLINSTKLSSQQFQSLLSQPPESAYNSFFSSYSNSFHPQAETQIKSFTLNVVWFDWSPCHFLKQIVDDSFYYAHVNVTCLPYGDWHPLVIQDLTKKTGLYDVIVADSQWIGELAEGIDNTGPMVLNLDDIMNGNGTLKEDSFDFALKSYGEYPPSSGKYYGAAFQGDIQMLVYRKDAFHNANLKPPATLEALVETAELFKNKFDWHSGFATFWCGRGNSCVDETPTIWNQFAWMHGGNLWDSDTFRIDGILNSPQNAEALRYTKRLFDVQTPIAKEGFDAAIELFCSGKSPMLLIWMAFAPTFASLKSCPGVNTTDIGYYQVPSNPTNNIHQLQLGGMGLVVNKYSSHQETSKLLVSHLTSYAFQYSWAKAGFYTIRKSVLADPDFVYDQVGDVVKYNIVYMQSFPLAKDYWNLGNQAELLKIQGKYLYEALSGLITPEIALTKNCKRTTNFS